MPSEPGRGPVPGRGSVRDRRWYRHLLVPVCVLAVLAVGEGFAAWVGPHLPRRVGSEERAFIKGDQMDRRGRNSTAVVLLGSSETAGGLVPGVMAKQARGLSGFYNAALAGSPLTLTDEWARRVVLPALHPEVVVIGMLPVAVLQIPDLKESPKGSTTRAYRSAFDQLDPGGLGSLGREGRRRSDLVRWRPYLRQPTTLARGVQAAFTGDVKAAGRTADAGEGIDWKNETDPAKVAASTAPTGEVRDYRQPSLDTTTDALGGTIYRVIATGRTDFDALAGLVAHVRRQGAVPVIALAPADRQVLAASNVDYARFDRLTSDIVAWGRRHRVPVHDGFRERWDRHLFHDRNHLDARGAQRWSVEVGRFLDDLCADHRLAGAC